MAEQLRNNVIFSSAQPPNEGRENGDLWVHSQTFNMYVWDNNVGEDGNPVGWVGVTSSQNQGSIVYVGDDRPVLSDVYPNLGSIGIDPIELNDPVNPLPGTLWFDTLNHTLKLWYVDGTKTNDGEWVAVTSAHYLTQAVNSEISVLRSTVANLQAEVDSLKDIIAGG
jgi:hypothetical protein